MKKFMSKLLLVSGIIFSSLACADTQVEFQSQPEQRLIQILNQLDLSADQKEKISQCMRQIEPDFAQNISQSHVNGEELKKQNESNYNAKTIAKLADAQGKIVANTIKLRMKVRHEIYEILTPIQRLKVAVIEKQSPQ